MAVLSRYLCGHRPSSTPEILAYIRYKLTVPSALFSQIHHLQLRIDVCYYSNACKVYYNTSVDRNTCYSRKYHITTYSVTRLHWSLKTPYFSFLISLLVASLYRNNELVNMYH